MCIKIVLLVLPLLAQVASAQDLEAVFSNTRLPSPRAYAPVAYDGEDSIYIWGGNGYANSSNLIHDILKYSLEKETIDVIGRSVPSQLGSGVWVGNETLVYFGGYSSAGGGYFSDVWNVKTSDGNNWTSVANLPNECSRTASVWDGAENTYTIGGFKSGTGNFPTIVRYNIVTHAVDIVGHLPNRDSTSAVWDTTSGSVFMFGGWTGFVGIWNDILKFDPKDGSLIQLDAVLPVPSADSCAVWTGKEAYIIGGYTNPGTPEWPQVVRFDPQTNEVSVVPVNNFPAILNGPGCTYVEKLNRIYIFGGRWTENDYDYRGFPVIGSESKGPVSKGPEQ